MMAKFADWLVAVIFATVGAIFTIIGFAILASGGANSSNGFNSFIFFPIFGGASFIFGMSIIIVRIIRKCTISELLNSGYYITAQIEEVTRNMQYSVNEMHPFIIICRWENPADGNTYLFKSENIWYNPESILERKNLTSLPVYLNPDNPKKYFISIEDIENEKASYIRL